MMGARVIRGVVVLLFVAGRIFLTTAHADTRAEEAVTLAQRLCLAGNEYRFSVNAKGDLTIKKLEPGAEVKAVVVKSSDVGALSFDDEKVRALVQEDIRKCSLDAFKEVYSSPGPSPLPNYIHVVQPYTTQSPYDDRQTKTYSCPVGKVIVAQSVTCGNTGGIAAIASHQLSPSTWQCEWAQLAIGIGIWVEMDCKDPD